MRFDIARKVVKFKNGQFGVRRWTLIGYQFLDIKSGDGYWWTSKECIARQAAGTEEQVRECLRSYLEGELPGYDKGRPA